jgi:uncharacterized protein (TIGR02265 family)
MPAKRLRDEGLGEVLAAERVTQKEWAPHKLYPVEDLLRLYAVLGAVLHEDPAEGIREASSGMVGHFASTWYGKFFERMIRPDPTSAMRWIERSRDFMANHGTWRLEVRAPRHVIWHMRDEFLWIESAQRGGAEGLLIACGVKGQVRAELDGPFDGRLEIQWDPRP